MSHWNTEAVAELFDMPFMELIFKAQAIHRQNFEPNQVQLATLLSIKTGTCPEDCSYCPQSAHYDTGLQKESLLDVAGVIEDAKLAKAS